MAIAEIHSSLRCCREPALDGSAMSELARSIKGRHVTVDLSFSKIQIIQYSVGSASTGKSSFFRAFFLLAVEVVDGLNLSVQKGGGGGGGGGDGDRVQQVVLSVFGGVPEQFRAPPWFMSAPSIAFWGVISTAYTPLPQSLPTQWPICIRLQFEESHPSSRKQGSNRHYCSFTERLYDTLMASLIRSDSQHDFKLSSNGERVWEHIPRKADSEELSARFVISSGHGFHFSGSSLLDWHGLPDKEHWTLDLQHENEDRERTCQVQISSLGGNSPLNPGKVPAFSSASTVQHSHEVEGKLHIPQQSALGEHGKQEERPLHGPGLGHQHARAHKLSRLDVCLHDCREPYRGKRSMWASISTRGDTPKSSSSSTKEQNQTAVADPGAGADVAPPVPTVRHRRLVFNVCAIAIVNQQRNFKECFASVVDEIVALTHERHLLTFKPKEGKDVPKLEMCTSLVTMAELLNKQSAEMRTQLLTDSLKEAACTLALTSELTKTTSDSSNLSAMVNSISRQYTVKYGDVIKTLYQLGLGHMRIALSKSTHGGTASSEEVQLHSRRSCDYMRHVTAEASTEKILYFSARLTIAQCLTILQRYADSLATYNEILEELGVEDNRDLQFFVCEAYLGCGEIKLRIREPKKALVIYDQAYRESAKLSSQKDRDNVKMKSLNKKGACYRELKKIDLSVEAFTEALQSAEAIMHEVGISTVSAALGSIYEKIGNYKKARIYYQKQYESSKRCDDRSLVGLAAGNLGNVIVMLNDPQELPKARDLLKEGLTKAEQAKNTTEVGRATCNLGNVHYAEQNYADALKMFRQACQISIENMDRIGQQRACGNIGNVYMSLEQPSLARDWYELARNLSPQVSDSSTEANTCYNVGCCYLALYLNEPETSAGTRHILQAEENFHSAVGLFEQMYGSLGSGKFSEVLKLSLFQGYVKAFRQLQYIYCTRGQHEVALELAERSHGMTFSDLLMHQLDSLQDGDSAPVIPMPLSSAEISTRVCQQTATVIIFSVCHDQLQFWVVEPHGGTITFRCKIINPTQQLISSSTGTDAILQKTVRDAMESITSLQDIESDYIGDVSVSIGLGKLFDVLIKPIRDLLPPPDIGEELVLVPCSALAGTAFGALFDTETGRYLSQMYSIRILPTCRMLGNPPPLQIKRIFTEDGTATELEDYRQYEVLAVGSPDIPTLRLRNEKNWSPPHLKFARREAVNVARHYGCRPLLGKEANKRAVMEKLPHARLVHFATHGLSGESSILLAPSPGVDTQTPTTDLLRECTLAPRDVEAMQLKADLVVLSACHSGGGPTTADGIMSLGRAFLLAGARAVMVTLWDIPDEATELLMHCFYHLARQEGWTSSSAMQQAMHQVRAFNRFILPKYWSGFEMIGRRVIINFTRPETECNPFWTDLIPRPLVKDLLPFLHTDVFDAVLSWLHGPHRPTGMVVHGLAGTGKSVLATQVATYYRCVFGERQVVWLDFTSSTALRHSAKCSLRQWAEHSPLMKGMAESDDCDDGGDGIGAESSLAQMIQTLRFSRFGYLLVLDGVDDLSLLPCLADLMECLTTALSSGLSPRLLATSRAPLLAEEFDDFKRVSTALLSAEESAVMLLHVTSEYNPATLSSDCDNYRLTALCAERLSGVCPLMVDQLAERVCLFPSCSFTALKKGLDEISSPPDLSGSATNGPSSLVVLKEMIDNSTRKGPELLYQGMAPGLLGRANVPCLDEGDGRDSGLVSMFCDNPRHALSYLLSASENDNDKAAAQDQNDAQDADVGDLLRCIIYTTCPIALPLDLIACQVSRLVYDGKPRHIFNVSGMVTNNEPSVHSATAAAGSGGGGGATISSLTLSETEMQTLHGAAEAKPTPEPLLVAVTDGIHEPPTADTVTAAVAVTADNTDSDHAQPGDQDDQMSSSGDSTGSSDALFIGLDGLHGWLSLLGVVNEDRIDDVDNIEAATMKSNLDWRLGTLSYSYSVRHAIETLPVRPEERDRRIKRTASNVTEYLTQWLQDYDSEDHGGDAEDPVLIIVDAAMHIADSIIEQPLLSSDVLELAVMDMMDAALAVILKEAGDHEGRFGECLQLITLLNEYFDTSLSQKPISMDLSGNTLDEICCRLLLRDMFLAGSWTSDATDLKVNDLRLVADQHLVVISSPCSRIGNEDIVSSAANADFFLSATSSSDRSVMVPGALSSASSNAAGYQVLTSIKDSSSGGSSGSSGSVCVYDTVPGQEVYYLLYGLLTLHSQLSGVRSGMWSVDEDGIMVKDRSLHLVVFDTCTLVAQFVDKARTVGSSKEIEWDMENFAQFVKRRFLDPAVERQKMMTSTRGQAPSSRDSQRISEMKRLISQCQSSAQSGSIDTLWKVLDGSPVDFDLDHVGRHSLAD